MVGHNRLDSSKGGHRRFFCGGAAAGYPDVAVLAFPWRKLILTLTYIAWGSDGATIETCVHEPARTTNY